MCTPHHIYFCLPCRQVQKEYYSSPLPVSNSSSSSSSTAGQTKTPSSEAPSRRVTWLTANGSETEAQMYFLANDIYTQTHTCQWVVQKTLVFFSFRKRIRKEGSVVTLGEGVLTHRWAWGQHTWARGGGRGDTHRLTFPLASPLPKAIFRPPNTGRKIGEKFLMPTPWPRKNVVLKTFLGNFHFFPFDVKKVLNFCAKSEWPEVAILREKTTLRFFFHALKIVFRAKREKRYLRRFLGLKKLYI